MQEDEWNGSEKTKRKNEAKGTATHTTQRPDEVAQIFVVHPQLTAQVVFQRYCVLLEWMNE
jgi:hypothetical protein